jgi:GNAT superfamily N-acetyltransferase
MPIITVKLQSPVRRTFRVEQVAGMFDLPLTQVQSPRSKVQRRGQGTGGEEQGTGIHPHPASCAHHPLPKGAGFQCDDQLLVQHTLTAEVPGLEEPWRIGAIVGPSGSGKTTLAKAAFGSIYKPRAWPRDRAIIDVIGSQVESPKSNVQAQTSAERGTRSAEWRQLDIKRLTQLLVAVGLGSPPTWLKPYHVLSGGERFRADLLQALLRVQGSGFGVQKADFRGQMSDLGDRRGAAREVTSTECSVPITRCPLVVIDEFTGALDRTIAKTTSAALSRLLHCSDLNRLRFVAVTCHTDILPWLSPDWVVELGGRSKVQSPKSKVIRSRSPVGEQQSAAEPLACAAGLCGRLIRGRPAKPRFKFTVRRVPQSLWTRFSGEHYLSGGLAASASCYAAFWGGSQATKPLADATGLCGEPIGFCASVAALGWKGTKRIQRLVVLPEFQGLSIGGKLLDAVALMEANKGFRVTITASHPAILVHCSRSQRWRYLEIKKLGSTPQVMNGREIASSVGRAVASFEFVAPARRAPATDQHRLS